jgi:hypothetical protein
MADRKGKRCGARKKNGQRCQQWAGHNTETPGFGPCSRHGGGLPGPRKAARREHALAFARGTLGAAVASSPVDAIEEAVHLAAGLVDYYRHEISAAATQVPMDTARIEELRPQFVESIKLEKDVAKAALDAGVAERRQRLAERQAALLAAAITDGLAEVFGELATVERRTAFAQVVMSRLMVLEAQDDEPLTVKARQIAA